jgi:hypothetical protein
MRPGLRIRAHKVDDEIGIAFKAFAKWLRQTSDFPIRFAVYLSPKEEIKGQDGKYKPSFFFAPFDNDVEPYLSVATGDFKDMTKDVGKDNALFSLLYSLALGVVRYKKWIGDNSGVDSYDPKEDATELLYEYIDHLQTEDGVRLPR